jgi:hypothetical protein
MTEKLIKALSVMLVLTALLNFNLTAQEIEDEKLKITGKFLTDQRFLLKDNNDWAWNETRLSVNLEKKIKDKSKFCTDIWLRNFGLPKTANSSDLYNKGIIDPYNIEIREAYVQITGFLSKKLDITVGRQRIVWGTADRLNPTDNMNPLDLEDILDFGRRRGSDAIRLNYYLNSNFSLDAVYLPFFQPANMPIGLFANALNPGMQLPPGLILKGVNDTLLTPRSNLTESSTGGIKFKGFAGGMDFSLSYVWGYEGLPFSTRNTFIPVDLEGGVNINSELSFARTHIIGADLATSLAGIGIWAEAAVFKSEKNVMMTTDLTALYPASPVPVTVDSLILDSKQPYVKFIVGVDYFFRDGSYMNIQYMHGFIHERGTESLNDYFFMQFEKKFFNDKLKVAPVGGGFIVTDWNNIKDNYALIYKAEIAFSATDNAELSLSPVFFDGKGDNLFANLADYNMLIFKFAYSF